MPAHPPSPPTTGLLLTGGGARAAYQVGVLEAIADIRASAGQQQGGNPFPVITGTSAGAINAAALASGRAAEQFAGMVAGLGGPADVLADGQLPAAPVVRTVRAPRDGVLAAMDTRALGLAVVALGGGRAHADDVVDPRVGLAQVLPLGTLLRAGDPLLQVHAASADAASVASQAVLAAITLADVAPAPGPVVIERL